MKAASHILASVILFSLFFVPAISHAQFPDLVICGKTTGPYAHPCGWNDLVQLAINLINFMIILSTFLATGVFAFIGIKLLTSGGNERAKEDAKGMAWKVLIGYLWILGAWLLVYTIENVLLSKEYSSLLGNPQ
jgi:hypothetical protein